MSSLPTYTGANRPSSPSAGDAIYLSDVNRLAVYDGDISEWRTFNSDGLVYNAAAPNELHYTNGIYDSASANYYLDVSPIMHFDANFINGQDSSGNPAVDDPVISWSDRSGNSLGIDLTQPTSTEQPVFGTAGVINYAQFTTTQHFDLSSSYTVGPAITQIIVSADPFSSKDLSGLTATSATGANTLFAYGNAYNSIFLGGGNSSVAHPNTTASFDLHVMTKDGTSYKYWYQGGSTFATRTGVSTLSTMNHAFKGYSPSGMNQQISEFIVFDSELTLAQLNKVKDYVNNKYSITASTFV